MALLIILGLLLSASAMVLLARGLAMSHMRVSVQVRQIDAYGFNATDGNRERAPRQSLVSRLAPLAERIGARVGGRGMFAPLDSGVLRAAGIYKISAETFHGYRVMAALGLPGLLLLMAVVGGSLSATTMLMLAAGGLICWMLLPAAVRTRAHRRMDELDRSLPELIDVLIATVEAGLGFAGSLSLVANRFDGPLGQELRLMQHEQGMGLSTQQAMDNMLHRCETPSVRAFVRAVSQGESLGVSIGAMLRNLAAETRKRRRQAAREKILKVPVKMMFPLVFLIFPALFIVLLYPAAVETFHALGGH